MSKLRLDFVRDVMGISLNAMDSLSHLYSWVHRR